MSPVVLHKQAECAKERHIPKEKRGFPPLNRSNWKSDGLRDSQKTDPLK